MSVQSDGNAMRNDGKGSGLLTQAEALASWAQVNRQLEFAADLEMLVFLFMPPVVVSEHIDRNET
jgi:hypothetical protein